MSEEQKDNVVIKSPWIGNLVMVVVVIIVLGGAVAFKEFF